MVRVTEKMITQASSAIGDYVDADRIDCAILNVEASGIKTMDAALAALENHEQMFEAAGGRGVELAESIDDLRIYTAVKDLIPQPKEFKLTVTVKGYDDQTPYDVAKAVDFVMRAGISEASECPEDWHCKLERDAGQLELCSVTTQ